MHCLLGHSKKSLKSLLSDCSGFGVRVTRGILGKSIWRPGVGLDQSGRTGIKRSAFDIYCEGRNHKIYRWVTCGR